VYTRQPPGRRGRGGPPGRGGKGTDRPGPLRPGERPRSLPAGETRSERRTVLVAGRAPLEELVQLAKGKGVPIEQVPGERLDKLTNGANHQGVAAVAAEYHYIAWADLMERVAAAGPKALLLLLDSLQDPQNFGTLLRTAEAVGVTGVIIPDHQAVGVTPAVANASSGAVEWLRVAQVTNMARTVEQLKSETGLWIYALAGDAAATPIAKSDLKGALGLVVGSEGKGVGALVRKRCDGAIALPMHGRIESLNASVAGSVVLYEVLRQRQAARPDQEDAP
jgi:23S rRNA (guanosine2251-2'-O)-methyltransferase